MEKHSRNNDEATWDRTNRGAFPKVGEGGQWCRVNGEFAVVRNDLDHKDPSACATKPATDRAGEADMVARLAIVLRQQLGPARTQPNAFTPDHGRARWASAPISAALNSSFWGVGSADSCVSRKVIGGSGNGCSVVNTIPFRFAIWPG